MNKLVHSKKNAGLF